MATLARIRGFDNPAASGNVGGLARGFRIKSALVSAVYPQGAKSTVTTSLAGNNNDLKFTARAGGTWGDSISVEYAEPTEDPGASTLSVEVDEDLFDIKVNLGMAADTYASLTTNLTGTNNDLKFTAVSDDPAVGNAITVAFVDPGTASAAISVGVVSSAITVNLATDAGTAASATLTSTGVTPSDGDTVVVNNRTYTFKTTLTPTAGQVLIGGSATVALDNLKSAVNGSAGSGTTYAAGTLQPTGVTAGTKTATTLVFNATAVGTASNAFASTETAVTLSFGGTTFAGGVNPAITSTAANVKTAVDASGPAHALVTVANKTGNNGTGVVTALTATPLAGGARGAANTAAAVKAAIEAHPIASDLVVVTYPASNNGTGAVIDMNPLSLTGGANTGNAEKFYQTVTSARTVKVDLEDRTVIRQLKRLRNRYVVTNLDA